MTNDEFHEKLDALAREVQNDLETRDPFQTIRDALEEAIMYDREENYQRRYSSPSYANQHSVTVLSVNGAPVN